MKARVLTVWDQYNAAQKHFFALWVACGFVTFACFGVAIAGVGALWWPAVIFGLLAAHTLTAWSAMRKIANLQAALDMKRFAFDAMQKDPLVTQELMVGLGGGSETLRARDGTQFRITCRDIGSIKGLGSAYVAIRVEYFG